MKKNNQDIDFHIPTRQSKVAILLIILKTYRIIVRQVLPIVIVFAVGKGFGGGRGFYFLIGVSVFALLGMVYSIINYFRYFFYINEEELVIMSGVFRRNKLNVPFDRIQTINFEQSIIHRIFNVVRLKIDTAGSAKAEFQFHALSNDRAEKLRDLLLTKKKLSPTHPSVPRLTKEQDTTKTTPEYKSIMQLNVLDLLKAGMVENHFRSGGIILAFMWWIWSTLDETGLHDDVKGMIGGDIYAQVQSSLMIGMVLLIIFIFLSFIVSVIKMVITNYNLNFLRSKTGFKINAGLFTKKDTSALDHKIQVISYGDNPLKKLIGIKDLRLKQASSVVLNKKTSIKIPSCKQHHIDLVKDTLYGKDALSDIHYSPVDKRYFYRNGGILAIIFTIIITGLLYFGQVTQATFVGIAAVTLIFSLYLSYRKKRFGYNTEMLVIRGGMYGDKTEMLPIYKIQSISRNQSPYQRRNQLADLVIHTASGKVGIPYIPIHKAQQVMDEFLYRIEVDRRKWM